MRRELIDKGLHRSVQESIMTSAQGLVETPLVSGTSRPDDKLVKTFKRYHPNLQQQVNQGPNKQP